VLVLAFARWSTPRFIFLTGSWRSNDLAKTDFVSACLSLPLGLRLVADPALWTHHLLARTPSSPLSTPHQLASPVTASCISLFLHSSRTPTSWPAPHRFCLSGMACFILSVPTHHLPAATPGFGVGILIWIEVGIEYSLDASRRSGLRGIGL